jgi:hypothetical protein
MAYRFDINGNPCPPVQTQTGFSQGYDDYTGMGPTRLEDTDLYARSISVSGSRLADEEPERPENFRRKVTRRVEVPFTRKVKVPVRTTKIMPTTVQVQVPVKKLVQVPSFDVVDEEYTVFEEREAVREKEIWVKQIVPEKYMQKVPVKMTRQVKKASHEVREVEELVTVDVPSTHAVEVDGFRIDDVEDTKMVEVEEFQEYEYQAHATGHPELSRTREMGRLPNSRIGRNIGADTFHAEHPDLRQLDLDSNPGQSNARPYSASRQNQLNRSQNQGRMSNSRDEKRDARQPDFHNDNFTHSDYIRPAGKNLALHATNVEEVNKTSQGLGLSVKNTHTRHSDGTGVYLSRLIRGSPAAMAGLAENDIITSVNDRQTYTVEQFAAVVKSTSGSLKVKFNRDGRRNGFAIIER